MRHLYHLACSPSGLGGVDIVALVHLKTVPDGVAVTDPSSW